MLVITELCCSDPSLVMCRAHLRPCCLQAAPAVPPHLQNEKDVLLRQLAPLHISRDYLYQASERTSGRAMTTGA